MDSMDETYSVKGKEVKLGEAEGLSQTTGWRTWNAALVSIEYMKALGDLSGKVVWDVSSGNGLLALVCEVLGAEVAATECGACLPLLERNIARNVGSHVKPIDHAWGQGLGELAGTRADIVILSDLLFIAFRDNIEHLLLNSILLVAPDAKTSVVLCYEERLMEREEAFVDELRKFFHFEKVEMEGVYLECLKDAPNDDDDDDGGGAGSLFYEDPPMVLYILTRK